MDGKASADIPMPVKSKNKKLVYITTERKTMTKKISFLLAIIMVFCSCVALSSCGTPVEEEPDGITSYLFDYHLSDDETYYVVTGYGVNTVTKSVIPDEYEGKPVKEIYHEAFANDANAKPYIQVMTLASTIEKIGFSAYYKCENLRTLNFNNGLKIIEDNAFGNCTSLTEAKLPEGLEFIGDFAFVSCKDLSTVVIPSTVKHIGSSAFTGTKYMNNAPVHNDNITFFFDTAKNAWVMLANYDIVDANLPDNAIGIASGAFSSCDALTTVEIPAGVKYISKKAFNGCTSLTTVNYGGSVEDFEKLVIEDGNDELINATWNFAK